MRRHVLDWLTRCFGLGHAHRGKLFNEPMLSRLFVVVRPVPEDQD